MPRKSVRPRRARTRRGAKAKSSKKSFLLLCTVALIGGFLATFGRKYYVSWQKSTWIPDTRFTVVVANRNPEVYSLDPTSGKVLKMVIPGNAELETRGYGKWLASSLWSLGKQEGKHGEILQAAVQRTFGIPVDGWVGPGGEGLFAYSQLGIISAYIGAISAGQARTDLTFYDRVSLKSRGNVPGNREEINLELSGVIKKSKLSDGTEGYSVIPEKTRVLDVFRDDRIFVEGRKLVILNASGKKGLAAHVSQISANLGLRIVSVESAQEASVAFCEVGASETQLQSLASRRLLQVFGCSSKVTDTESGEIKLVLGAEFAKDY